MNTDNTVNFEQVTPELAHEYLGMNTRNRNLRKRVVEAYARDMANGDWRWNGESIKFSRDGVLLDGQHRLAAIVESGATVPMLVIKDLPMGTQDTMDTGAKRKFSDVLALRGERHTSPLAATLRAAVQWESGDRSFTGQVSNSELSRMLERYPSLRDGMPVVSRVAASAKLPTAVGGLAWWLFTNIDTEDADFFFDRIASDQGHYKGEPFYALRSILGGNELGMRGTRSKRFLVAVTIKAWNKFRAGESVGLLRFRVGGAAPESFPEPK